MEPERFQKQLDHALRPYGRVEGLSLWRVKLFWMRSTHQLWHFGPDSYDSLQRAGLSLWGPRRVEFLRKVHQAVLALDKHRSL